MSIELKSVSYIYSPGTAYEMRALDNINLTIPENQFVGMIGHTGSGKSTLIQLFNGLLKPTGGKVFYKGEDIWKDGFSRKNLRSQVGLAFQYPEYQLFEVSVLKDVCFGPRNQGLDEEQAKEQARKALEQTGVPRELFDKSPFELSGGQKKRVAIAGVLAMNPRMLVLDEPTAGLDPRSRDELLERIAALHRTRGITVVLVSHSMEDIARYVQRLIVLNAGRVAYDGTPRQVFAHYRELEHMGLAAPQIAYVMRDLQKRGLPVDVEAITVEEARDSILKALGRAKA